MINIRDLIVDILLHWRSMILWMFVGGLISVILSYAGFLQSSEAIRREQSGVLDLQSEMTQKELSQVEQVLFNEDSLEKWNSYLEDSVLMNLDPSHVYQEDLIYAIMEGTQPDLMSTYVNLLTANEMYQFAAKRTNGSFTASEIQELINVTNIGTSLNQKNNSFNITILAGTKEDCIMISDAVKKYIEEIFISIGEVYGSHELVLLQENVADMNDISLLQKQIDMRNKVISLQTDTAMLKELFSEKQRRYYQLRINETDAEGGNRTEVKEGTDETGTSMEMPADIKDAVWGMFFAVLIYVLALFFRYILDDRLRYTDNCTTIYHVPALGHIPVERAAHTPFRKIDQKLYLLRDKRRYTSSAGEAFRLSVAAIKMASQRKGLCGVCGVGGSISSEAMEEIKAGLKADNIEFQSVKDILYSADSLNLLSSVRAAVLIEKAGAVSYGEIWQELEILQRQGIDILGIVVVE